MKSIDFYFNLIYKHYNIQVAKRSKVPLIAHIIEGVNVLHKINASEDAIKAFMIHPLVQDDSIVGKYQYIHAIDPKIMLLAMEYRSVANSYLSKRKINNIEEINLSPLKDVNDMLIADKVQNYKDFLHYHKNTHERSSELDIYFNNWFKRLNVDFESLVDVCYNTAVTIRIKNNDKYLLLNRYSTDRTYVGQCHPGGKLEIKETLFDALKREVFEEISVDLNIDNISFLMCFLLIQKKV